MSRFGKMTTKFSLIIVLELAANEVSVSAVLNNEVSPDTD
jgi:hypothetical protein